ncbi:MAG: hypothetical protein ACTSYX_08040, partial [Candidatus Thorarchaeota archaeon]
MPIVYLREKYQSKDAAIKFEDETKYEAVLDALLHENADENHYVEWYGTREVAVLDVDWHAMPAPDSLERDRLMRMCQPQPSRWWESSGGGLHLLYCEKGDVHAEVYAAMAALFFLTQSTCDGVEIIPRTKATKHSSIVERLQTTNTAYLNAWLKRGGADVEQIEQWLSHKGWRISERRPHTDCIIDPRYNAKGGVPIHIGEEGIQCYVCNAGGGSGFRSWGSIVGAKHVNKLHGMAQNFVPWTNAYHYMQSIWGRRASIKVLKNLYWAALDIIHAVDHPLKGACFINFPYLLGDGGIWLNSTTFEPTNLSKTTSVFNSIPSAMYAKREEDGTWGKPKKDNYKWSQHFTSGQLPQAYPVHRVVHGAEIWGKFQQYAGDLVPLVKTDKRGGVTYNTEAIDIDDAWAIFEESFPGLDHNYLLLLLAARGFAESGEGPIPMIMVTGPSGAGKSGIPRIAAEVLGDLVIPIPYRGDNRDNLAEGLGEAFAKSHGWVGIDEFCKNLSGFRAADAFTPFLMTDRMFTYRKLYKGPVQIQVRSSVIVTNTEYPIEVLQDAQIGRRFVRVELTRRVPNWEKTAINFDGWRTREPAHTAACEALYKYVIDRWFSSDPDTFKEVAAELGYDTQLSKRDEQEGVSVSVLLRDLFDAVCDVDDSENPRWRGRGWKVLEFLGQGRLGEAWDAVRDPRSEVSSRRVSETDLAATIGLAYPTKLEISKSGQKIALRFCRADVNSRSKDFKVNNELKPTVSGDPPKGSPPPAGRDEEQKPPIATSDTVGTSTEGTPSKLMLVDIETRSNILDLDRVGGRKYAKDPSTSILCAVFISVDSEYTPVHIWCWDPGKVVKNTKALWPTTSVFDRLPITYGMPCLDGVTLVAHNADGFDRLVWQEQDVPQPAGWDDSLPLARMRGLPGKLDKIGDQLFGQGKDAGAKNMLKMCKPDRKNNFIKINEKSLVPVIRYCVQDTLILAHMWRHEHMHDVMSGNEHAIRQVDKSINRRGVPFDVGVAEKIIKLSTGLIEDEGRRIEDITDKEIKPKDLQRRDFILHWLRDNGLELPDLKAATITQALLGGDEEEQVLEADGISPIVFDVLRARQGVTKITVGKLNAALNTRDEDNRLRDILHYYAAHTGRWGG